MKIFQVLAIAVLMAAASHGSSAMPLAPVWPPDRGVTKIAGGCGVGSYPDQAGNCRRRIYPFPAHPVPCPPGYRPAYGGKTCMPIRHP